MPPLPISSRISQFPMRSSMGSPIVEIAVLSVKLRLLCRFPGGYEAETARGEIDAPALIADNEVESYQAARLRDGLCFFAVSFGGRELDLRFGAVILGIA